jgi:hypothetical protein
MLIKWRLGVGNFMEDGISHLRLIIQPCENLRKGDTPIKQMAGLESRGCMAEAESPIAELMFIHQLASKPSGCV